MTTQHRIGSLSTFTILCLVLSAPVFAQVNGPPNGTIGAYFIDAGNAVSDSFVATTSFFTTGFVFAEWVPAGATPLTVDWSVGTSPFGSDIGSGIGAIGPVTNFCLSGAPVGSGFCGNNKGYDVDLSTVTVPSFLVIAGNTYYLTVTDATDSSGSASLFDGWDINFGPSIAYDQCGNPHGGSVRQSYRVRFLRKRSPSSVGGPLLSPAALCCSVRASSVLRVYSAGD